MSELVQELTFDQRDCLQEIVNVAMGQAGDSLARLLEVFVTLSIPKISTLRPHEIRKALASFSANENFSSYDQLSAIRQSYRSNNVDEGLNGEALVIFGDSSFKELADLLAYDDEELGEALEQELLLDVANVLSGACLNGLAEQLEQELIYSPPSILGQHVSADELIDREQLQWELALSVEINYTLENREFNCDLLLLMPDSSIAHLVAKLDEFLEE